MLLRPACMRRACSCSAAAAGVLSLPCVVALQLGVACRRSGCACHDMAGRQVTVSARVQVARAQRRRQVDGHQHGAPPRPACDLPPAPFPHPRRPRLRRTLAAYMRHCRRGQVMGCRMCGGFSIGGCHAPVISRCRGQAECMHSSTSVPPECCSHCGHPCARARLSAVWSAIRGRSPDWSGPRGADMHRHACR